MEAVSSVEGRRALEVVVCLGDSVVDVIHLRTAAQVQAGSEPGCRVSLAPEVLGGQTRVTLASLDASGQAFVARGLGASAEPGLRALGSSENASLADQGLRVLVRWVPDVTPAPRGGVATDRRWLGFLAATTAAMTLVMAILFAIPPDAKAVAWLEAYKNDRLIKVQAKPTEDPLLKPPVETGLSGGDAGGVTSAPAVGDQGKQGRPDEKTRGKTALKGTMPEDRPGAGNPREWVQNRGPLGVLRQTDWSPVTGGAQEWGSRDKYAYGSDTDGPDGDGNGSFGGGYEGNGPGGCPPGATHCIPGSIGVGDGPGGRIGSGFCRDNPDKCGYGPGRQGGPVTLGPRDPKGPVVDIRPPVVEDGLDKAIIKRVVKAKYESFRYCYEKQLTVDSDIEGTIGVSFVIGPNGNVISATAEGTAGSDKVDGCVMGIVRDLQFPKSSSMTKVKYPFTFRAAGR